MKLEGSCHCGAVKFSVDSPHPYPFNVCYCSVCRKTAGSGGLAINLGADSDSLKIEGEEHTSTYKALIEDAETGERKESLAERKFCNKCGSHLWVWDPRWPELLHPHAGAIDTPLPTPPERTHLLLDSKPDWVNLALGEGDQSFEQYPKESIAQWHERFGHERLDLIE